VTKDRRLGKGLAALLGTPLDDELISDGAIAQGVAEPATHTAVAGPTESVSSGPRLIELDVTQIDNNPFQPRRSFPPEEMAALAASLRSHQQLQPVLVRKQGERFQLISGERRLRAAQQAGLPTVRAEVREADDRLMAELAIVENLQRKDLTALEKAAAFKRYIEQHRCDQGELARRLGIDRSTISNLIRLLELPKSVQDLLQSDQISAGHARALLPLGEEEQQVAAARRIIAEQWSVRQIEQWVAEQIDEKQVPAKPAEPNRYVRAHTQSVQIAALEQELKLALGTKVELRSNSRGRGRIVIQFSNHQEFERLRGLLLNQLKAAPARVA
jgi:ParB family chromosome partitioning protein